MHADLLPAIRTASAELTAEEWAAPILVGVSGGPDSLALLHALGRWRADGGPAIVAIHVDHRLRPESAAEAVEVAARCAEWGIPFAARVAGLDSPPTANIEQVARDARYRCFAEEAGRLGALTLALAHHADDQAETLLLHLLRGAGLAGLAGMPVIRREGDLLDPICAALGASRPAVWRPLLGVRRATILAYGERWQLTPIHDPSNDDVTLRRNALRHRIIPLLEEHFPGASGILARNASLLADDERFMQEATDRAQRLCEAHAPGLIILERAAFREEPLALQRRILRAAWGRLRDLAAPLGLDADTVETARSAILSGKTGSQYSLPGGLLLTIDFRSAAIGPADTLAAQLRQRHGLPLVVPGWSRALPDEGTLAFDAHWSLEALPGEPPPAHARTLHIPMDDSDDSAPLLLRTWQPGDRVRLTGGRSRKLQDWFTDRHIPGYLRHHLPLLAQGNRVLWVVRLGAFPHTLPPRNFPESLPPFIGRRWQIAPVVLEGRGGATRLFRLLYNDTPVEPIA